MVLENSMDGRQEKHLEIMSPILPFSSPLKDEVSIDLISTSSTDTDSSFSIGSGEGETVGAPPDIESPIFGASNQLRHRNGEMLMPPQQEHFVLIDSDSEHGLLPRKRRKPNNATISAATANLKTYLFYGLASFVALSSLYSIKTTFVSSQESAQWKHFMSFNVPIVRKAFTKYQPEDQYTIILKGGRLDLLQQSLDNFSRCSSVAEIHVDFTPNNNIIGFPIPLLAHESRKVVPYSETLSTNAVFLLSEGILLSCGDMDKGFQTWRKDPRRLVGFFGYKVRGGDDFSLSRLEHVVPGSGSYTFISNRAVFVHKLYLDSLPSVNFGIERDRYCCDVSLSLQVSLAFGKSPVVMKAKVVDLLEGSGSSARIANEQHQQGLHVTRICEESCIPKWLPIGGGHAISHEHTAILG